MEMVPLRNYGKEERGKDGDMRGLVGQEEKQ